jgi:hypothetical protein
VHPLPFLFFGYLQLFPGSRAPDHSEWQRGHPVRHVDEDQHQADHVKDVEDEDDLKTML